MYQFEVNNALKRLDYYLNKFAGVYLIVKMLHNA